MREFRSLLERGRIPYRRAQKKMPPGTLKVSPLEVARFLGNPLQVGYPASMNTDAWFGFSVKAYQSRGSAYGHCEAWQSTLVRVEDPSSNGRDGETDSPCQRGKVVYCPCCTRATHVAIPPPYPLGPYAGLKHTGIRLLVELGLWAPRRLVAIEYSTRFVDRCPLSTGGTGLLGLSTLWPRARFPGAIVAGALS